jgi:hypothetical protein
MEAFDGKDAAGQEYIFSLQRLLIRCKMFFITAGELEGVFA